jgi:hypothetical protein
MAEFVTSKPKARKPHRCSDCHRRIDPGETYRRGVGFDGTAWTWKDCAHCLAALSLYDLAWDGEYNADSFATWSTDGAHDLRELRDQAGYRMKWRTRSGRLLPVPQSTDTEGSK